MATAPGHVSVKTSSNSAFGQFRQTQFLESAVAPPNATFADQMLRKPRSSTGPNPDRASISANPALKQSAPSANFGHLELAELPSNSIPEGILGPNKDGRVRNPVPSKLKGKTDGNEGAFGVMHMDLSAGKKGDMAGKDIAAERDAAARRTSEKTASVAKAAQQEGYVPPRKRRVGGDEQHHEDRGRAARPLAPDETKFEQARLLTLLRSINPVTVVDQLCKAVAYFGGIPGAPPPEDGIFPESANTRETGALFIGWLSEIFPDLSKAPSPEITRLQDPPKKARGRPRKENAIEHEPVTSKNAQGQSPPRPQVARPSWARPSLIKTSDDAWGDANEIDAHAPVHSPQIAPRGTVTAPDVGLPANLELFKQVQEQDPSTPNNLQPGNVQSATNSASKRGRGRPKGSRNKRLDEQQEEETRARQNNPEFKVQHQTTEMQGQQSGQQGARDKPSGLNAEPSTEEEQRALIAHQQSLLFGKPLWGGAAQKELAQKPAGTSPLDGLSAEERAVLEAFRNQRAQGTGGSTKNTTAINATSGEGVKRKRPAPNQNNESARTFQSEQTVAASPQGLIISNEAPANMAKESLQWEQMGTPAAAAPTAPAPANVVQEALQWNSTASTPIVPPAKRQRKPKDPIAPPPRKKSASISSNKGTPPSIPSTIPDSQASASQQSTSATRPPAEGLEAHYERFTNLQQSSRGHTPTVPQRQNTNPTSTAPQRQNTPSQPLQPPQKQKPQQQQASQQADKTVDQIMTQTSSARPSSSTFYNQTRYTPYSQQYPSHQPSQQYGTQSASQSQSQASPRVSNSSNSYRSGNSSTLPRAPPQFSQSQVHNSYKAASPHPLSQPSPSFSQADSSSYRTSNTHSVAQASPLFSPRASQTQSSQQSHQSHYNHFPSSSYIDLPTLESLDHSSGGGSSSVGLNPSAYGQGIGVGLGASRSGSTGTYGSSSGLSNAFETGTRGSQSGSHGGYNTTSGLSNAFGTGTSEQELQERLLGGLRR